MFRQIAKICGQFSQSRKLNGLKICPKINEKYKIFFFFLFSRVGRNQWRFDGEVAQE